MNDKMKRETTEKQVFVQTQGFQAAISLTTFDENLATKMVG